MSSVSRAELTESSSSPPCPFCGLLDADAIAASALALTLWDRFPVSDGHALVVPRRHVATWFDTTPAERLEMFDLLDRARRLCDERHRPHGYNIGINVGAAAGQTVGHLHLHLIPRYEGDVPDPTGGVRHVIPSKANYLTPSGPPDVRSPRELMLLDGQSDAMLSELVAHFRDTRFDRIDLAVSFILLSGLRLIAGPLEDALQRGAHLRILTTDYLGVTEPAALAWLLDRREQPESSAGRLETRVFDAAATSFHPKAYIFWSASRPSAAAFVGSSNISRAGLSGGVEWNLRAAGAGSTRAAFEALWGDPRSRTLTEELLRDLRTRVKPRPEERQFEPVSEDLPTPNPYPIQEEALRALEQSRAEGYRAGLVVMATGLGKTWLAAFDSSRAPFERVLFVAHRAEILTQSRDVFRQVRSDSTLGLFMGPERQPDAEVVFASVQTLARHLPSFAPNAFDYIVVDEFHHAAAQSYRRVIDHFSPRFLLGLTATPERMDGSDLLSLCGDHLAFRCDLVEGVHRKALCPFHYFGIKDVADFKSIPWRNGRFDPEALTRAVETQDRASQALDEWRSKGATRALAFCCSITHADFMARIFRERGVSAVAVHSGPTSAARHEAVEALEAGRLEVLFSVDVFNEGLDVPHIDTVMMLRPTESPVIFLQQLGRGLRTAPGKERLTVIDFIGNHRSFLLKPRTLLSLGPRLLPAPTEHRVLDAMRDGGFGLPEGCRIAYDLEVVEMLRALSRRTRLDALADFCLAYHEEQGSRPFAAQALRAGLNPQSARSKHGGWFDLLASLQLLEDDERATLTACGDFLHALEIEAINKSYKLVVLRALIHEGSLLQGLPIDQLARVSHQIVSGDPRLLADIDTKELPDPAGASPEAWRAYWRKWPIAAWLGELSKKPSAPFVLDEDRFRLRKSVPPALADAFTAMVAELVDSRLARYYDAKQRPASPGVMRCKVDHASGRPIIRLDRQRHPDLPQGQDIPFLADGQQLYGNFVKIALNVARRPAEKGNAIHDLLRGWFGPSAGLPGTSHYVVFEKVGAEWSLRPASSLTSVATDAPGTSLPLYPSYRVACGAFERGRDPDPAPLHRAISLESPSVALDSQRHFLAYAEGDSMEGGPDPIRPGDLLLFEWARNAAAADLVAERTLVTYGSAKTPSAVLKTLDRDPSGSFRLVSTNTHYPPITGTSDLQVLARLLRRLHQRDFNPLYPHLHDRYKRRDVPPLFGDTFNAGRWGSSGHISLPNATILFVTLTKSSSMTEGAHYEDRLEAPDLLSWSSQSSTSQTSKKGRELLKSPRNGTHVHLFLRARKADVSFTYCGLAVPLSAEGDRPIHIRWRLYDPVPPELMTGA